ncbi:5-amino-6-(5-phosphoribosylamino)uracil reductase [Clostridiales bacterium CHKCI006]|nr:5-amino-6-(5-phosphoribosylamino)uracil reductase [Clostridiales bacterium CHKCI006]
MPKPYVICHMLQSIDGRIDGSFFGVPTTAELSAYYQKKSQSYKADAVFYGRTTAVGIFTGDTPLQLAPVNQGAKEDYIVSNHKGQWVVVIDALGTLPWTREALARPRLSGRQVLMILSEAASLAYLDYLRSLGISYILAGAQNIDLALALDKCDRLAGIHRITLQGGGIINGSFAKAGLIDEISLVITPVLEGTTGIATSFDTDEAIGMDEYRLIQTEVICDNGLWLNYQRQ